MKNNISELANPFKSQVLFSFQAMKWNTMSRARICRCYQNFSGSLSSRFWTFKLKHMHVQTSKKPVEKYSQKINFKIIKYWFCWNSLIWKIPISAEGKPGFLSLRFCSEYFNCNDSFGDALKKRKISFNRKKIDSRVLHRTDEDPSPLRKYIYIYVVSTKLWH